MKCWQCLVHQPISSLVMISMTGTGWFTVGESSYSRHEAKLPSHRQPLPTYDDPLSATPSRSLQLYAVSDESYITHTGCAAFLIGAMNAMSIYNGLIFSCYWFYGASQNSMAHDNHQGEPHLEPNGLEEEAGI